MMTTATRNAHNTAIPADRLTTSSFDVYGMICKRFDHPYWLDDSQIDVKMGIMLGCKQAHVVLWANNAYDDWGPPDAPAQAAKKHQKILAIIW